MLPAPSSRVGMSAHAVRFGLGHWTGAEWVAIQWVDGVQIVLRNVPAGRRISVPADLPYAAGTP